ncbi:hypothetical protein IFM89_024125, partial [Coptis chinensis]
KMVNGGTIHHWMCINFSQLNQDCAGRFFIDLVSMCNSKGMSINPKPLLPLLFTRLVEGTQFWWMRSPGECQLSQKNQRLFFGADVTHPPREDSSPSIAAVVASMGGRDIKIEVRSQRQHHHRELIQDLYSLVEDPQKGTFHAGMIR